VCLFGVQADLPAEVVASISSKVVTLPVTDFLIPARASRVCKVEFVPRKINSAYRRKITLRNLRNARNECVVEAVASNMDPHHVLYHSRFYKVLTHNKYKSPQVRPHKTA
jgi:hypothetical protein